MTSQHRLIWIFMNDTHCLFCNILVWMILFLIFILTNRVLSCTKPNLVHNLIVDGWVLFEGHWSTILDVKDIHFTAHTHTHFICVKYVELGGVWKRNGGGWLLMSPLPPSSFLYSFLSLLFYTLLFTTGAHTSLFVHGQIV